MRWPLITFFQCTLQPHYDEPHYTLQPHYDEPYYNAVFSITWSCYVSQKIFLL